MQQRESRQPVIVLAQMRGRDNWSDVTIRNISPHGMLLLASRPPKPGDYVEIRKSSLTLVGRAVWVKGKAFGVQLIERLNFNALLKAANEAYAAQSSHSPPPDKAPAPAIQTLGLAPAGETAATRGITWVVTLGFLALALLCAGFETFAP